jgi:hypothetical protein
VLVLVLEVVAPLSSIEDEHEDEPRLELIDRIKILKGVSNDH